MDETLEGACPADEADVEKLCTPLLHKGFIVQCLYTPIIEKKSESGERKVKKWPDRVTRKRTITDSKFDPEGFYIVMYEGRTIMARLYYCICIYFVLSLSCILMVVLIHNTRKLNIINHVHN